MSNLYKDIGQNLRAIRKSRKQTQATAAKVIGKTGAAIVNYELGKRSIDLESILELCKFYEVSVNDILPEENKPVGDELVAEMKFLEDLKALHFSAEERSLILDFVSVIIKARSC